MQFLVDHCKVQIISHHACRRAKPTAFLREVHSSLILILGLRRRKEGLGGLYLNVVSHSSTIFCDSELTLSIWGELLALRSLLGHFSLLLSNDMLEKGPLLIEHITIL